ncbi:MULTISPECIES: MiaB/RimO family radical SAM methylthiotransferase [unclassified Sphingopyxis]|uniref:MiaB/RimO family radical SAM methylthiotransferase n=1 Tax=unclassified Sphingopyxis TaxID=2614943 RepID=UPI0007300860|nr:MULTISPECIES: MiaB/RimO family radical SAM methylthiotransferase [unclassified Sphingopyxis]KTE25895.1 tRNA (N(6)-L-threonylcarbamoyladenosine(37)-C(2))-methylthiotransferase MtaB [Sphingopyxis sp. H057]KTE51575.1 tRNA (N(6)-L-threonylcarbamoyladenosine(37)-C(2))-methylthiotransferase MtaB [Sphingopyxis sp. H073]KTE53922.1 tRNA (N(6)-L-threonylcarbamoyladenosine(37)-C(2))-methylthiotransferase MtaB [Sphingopyxis sp. H071]KTE58925.1 tRNA (N(6)-L-threonylcarbamoyladenosine(37)-C(2))-methylthio
MTIALADRVEVVNFGCRLNIAEGEAVRAAARAAGARDTIVFNSCAVTDEAVRQARQAVRRALRERPGAEVVVTGCAAELEAETFAAMGARVVRNDAKGLVKSYKAPVSPRRRGPITGRREIAPAGDGPPRSRGNMTFDKPAPYQPALSGADHARAFLGVQTGCSHSCTFCATVLARGTARSATTEAVLDAARTAIDRGQREIILTGVDLASYGDDSGTSLAALVEALLTLPVERLRLSSLDPNRIDDALFALLTEEARVMPHVHLSLQAGDDMVLTRMKRRHRRADAVRLTERLRAARPDIAIGADLIAGFPTEDDTMFAHSMALIDDCDIVFGHIFPYSPRAGTPAARMPQVGRAIARERAAKLREANARRRTAWLDTQIGRTASMLVERDGLTGHAENFAALTLATPAEPGSILPVRLTAREGDRMLAA